MKDQELTRCISCLYRRKCCPKGWCSTCTQRHTCRECKQVSASVKGLGGTCGDCRAAVRIMRANRSVSRLTSKDVSLPRILANIYRVPPHYRRGKIY